MEASDKPTTSMDITEMQELTQNLIEQPEKSGPVDAFLPSEQVLNLSPDEFEQNLEGNVRQLLLNAVSELVGQAISSLPGTAWKDDRTASTLRSVLISEFAPLADIIMETIVSKDYKRWLETLKMGSGSVQQRQQFENLHNNFQEVLNSDITADAVQQICRAVVSAEELYAMVQARSIELSKSEQGLSKASTKLSSAAQMDLDDSGVGLDSLQGTAEFGEEDAEQF